MKLNKRLSTLFDMAEKPYQRVWDCCCDHGLLGYHFLKSGHIQHVHFLDIVPNIIKQLEINLLNYSAYIAKGCQWTTHCCDVSDIPLITNTNVDELQLVIISGVGGELICKMIDAIKANNPDHQLDFLLSPVHHSYKLRKYLKDKAFLSVNEKLIYDNKRFYEALLVSHYEGNNIHLTGGVDWASQSEHQQYILKLIEHYQRIVENESKGDMLASEALHDYRLVYEKLYK